MDHHFTVEQIVSRVKMLYAIKEYIQHLNQLAEQHLDDAAIQTEISGELYRVNLEYAKVYNHLIETAENKKVEEWIQMHAPLYRQPLDPALKMTMTANMDELDIRDLRKYLGNQDLTQTAMSMDSPVHTTDISSNPKRRRHSKKSHRAKSGKTLRKHKKRG